MRFERRNTLCAVLLMALLMAYKVSVTMFVHTHDVDGTMVVHSHPFTNSHHSHSSSQILIIGQLSSFNGVEHAVYEEFKVYHNSVEEIEFIKQNLNVINPGEECVSLRAPPVCC